LQLGREGGQHENLHYDRDFLCRYINDCVQRVCLRRDQAAIDGSSTAQPMAAAQLQKAYAGRSVSFPDGSQVFWGPDGNAKGFFRKYHAIGDGTWDATDGKVCNHMTWRGLNAKPGEKPTTMSNCWRYMVDGKRIFHQFTSDTLKSDDGWWMGPSDLTKLKPGNILEVQYNAVKAKMH
jgi:hypothetical protein